jgi:hypothetical protein
MLVAVLVGMCWGVTNILLRVGVLRARQSTPDSLQRALKSLVGQHWAALLSTPSFVVPQLLNWLASATLVSTLAGSKLHVAMPVANAVSIAATAATARLLGDRLQPVLLSTGVVCVAAGVALTSL